MLIVIGDEICDRDENLTTSGRCAEGCQVVTRETEQRPGGAAAVAAMVRALGGDCLLLGNSRCNRQRSIKTRVRLDGELLYRIDDDVTDSFSADIVKLIEVVTFEPSVVLLSDYAKGAIDRAVVQACLSRGWRVVADPHITADPNVFDGIWGIKISGERPQSSFDSLVKRHERTCLTYGQAGLSATDESGHRWYPATAELPIIDSVGCGDQVLAAIGWQLSLGNDWLAACEWGNLAAGIKCGKRGTTPVTLDEVKQAIERGLQCGQTSK